MGRTRKKIENCRLSPANETYNSSHTLGAKKVGKHFNRILHCEFAIWSAKMLRLLMDMMSVRGFSFARVFYGFLIKILLNVCNLRKKFTFHSFFLKTLSYKNTIKQKNMK